MIAFRAVVVVPVWNKASTEVKTSAHRPLRVRIASVWTTILPKECVSERRETTYKCKRKTYTGYRHLAGTLPPLLCDTPRHGLSFVHVISTP